MSCLEIKLIKAGGTKSTFISMFAIVLQNLEENDSVTTVAVDKLDNLMLLRV